MLLLRRTIAPWLNQTPSFMVSGTVPLLYTLTQAVVEYLPRYLLPVFNLQSELPLAVFDALTRAFLLCNLIPPMVVASASSAISGSPWTLLITSLVSIVSVSLLDDHVIYSGDQITANTGFFVLNSLSFLQPGPLSLTTPAELLPYGWSTTDLWCAPLITGLYALLTHAQPFWAEAHAILAGLMGPVPVDPATTEKSPDVLPLDAETARAVCAAALGVMFVTRAVKNYGSEYARSWQSKRNVKVISRHGAFRCASLMTVTMRLKIVHQAKAVL